MMGTEEVERAIAILDGKEDAETETTITDSGTAIENSAATDSTTGTKANDEADKEGGLIHFVHRLPGEPLPPKPPTAIEGIAYHGDVVLVQGPSKAGKSFLVLELALATATGGEWLGRACARDRVLYVAGELTEVQTYYRLDAIAKARGLGDGYREDIFIWDKRAIGDSLVMVKRKLAASIDRDGIGMVILDPAYTMMEGDENSAGESREFFKALGFVAEKAGCTVVLVHHHSKGAKGDVSPIDRSAGTGLFGRYCNAILDLIQLHATEGQEEDHGLTDEVTAWRVDVSLRDFSHKGFPFDVWWRFPIHVLDQDGVLADLSPMCASTRGGTTRGAQVRQAAGDRWADAEKALVKEIAATGTECRITTKRAMEVTGYKDRKTLVDRVRSSDVLDMLNPTKNESFVTLRE